MQIAVVATGGTIASRRNGDGQLLVGEGVHKLLASLPASYGVELVGVEFSSVPSFVMSPDDMLAIVGEIRQRLSSGFDGVIVTHGTDTLEETAYVVGQYLPRNARVVLTGAQRSADERDSDAARNLSDAVRVVCADVPLGPTVVAGGVAIAAVEARKVHTSSLLVFSGGAAGAVALVDDDGIHPLATPRRGGYYADLALPERLPRVDLVKLVAGSDGLHVRASLQAGSRGVVLEAFGSGNATEDVLEAVREAANSHVPVVITTRTGGGRARSIYGDVGGGADLTAAGAIFAADLTGPRARMALAMALAAEAPSEVRAAVEAMVGGMSR